MSFTHKQFILLLVTKDQCKGLDWSASCQPVTFIFLGWRSVQFLDKLNFHSIISKEHVACEKKMKKLLFVCFFFSPWRRMMGLSLLWLHLERGYREDGTRLFSEGHRECPRGNRHGLQQRRSMTEQGCGLYTARGPFPSKSFCYFFFFLDGDKKILPDLLLKL